tara:strand:+ start:3028 stop:3774 length:747 start_codon:yes stop_codon:yes gene_type:complete
MFEIKNENELIRLLKIISEVSVEESRRKLRESKDSYANNFKKELANDMSLFREQDEEGDEATPPDEDEEMEDAKKAAEEETEEGEGEGEEAADEEVAGSDYSDDFAASYDSVVTAINALRSGRSLKDKKTSTELRDYYDRLDENERAVLLLFLKELSKILLGNVEGEEAQDPSDPKTYFNITKRDKDEEESGSEKNVIKKGGEEIEAQQKDPGESDTGGEEDTTPPIKVNESQDIKALKRKVLLLMRG